MKHFDSFALDTGNQCLWQHGVQLALAPKPFAVLCFLVENPGRLITHDELLDALWPKTYVQPQVLRTYMLELRKVLGDDAGNPRFIQTVPKRGFRFIAPVVECKPVEPKPKSPAAQDRTAATNSQHTGVEDLQGNGIVGRDEELSHLKKIAGQMAGGQRQVVFVTGEVGIGKTALVDAFSRWAGSSYPPAGAATVARGQCIEGFGRKEEYYPVMEALRQLCASPDGEIACRILNAVAPSWMAGSGSGTIGETKSETAGTPNGERMPGDICRALEELSAARPLILVFEDLHWADESTLHLLSALARRRGEAQLMILATCRPAEGAGHAAAHQLKAIKQDLLMRHLCSEMALSPLSKSAMRELLTRELNGDALDQGALSQGPLVRDSLPPGLASFVHQHSEGNPLFAIAMLEHLIAQQFLVRAGTSHTATVTAGSGGWEQRAPFPEMESLVPDGLAQMIELEIERLSGEEKCLLEAGSLMHVAFPAWAVAAALGKEPEETEEACDALARRLYFLERAGQDELPDGTCSTYYVFAHGLFREVLYQRQSSSRRAQRHTRIAERLEQLFRGRETDVARDVAMHFEAAGNSARAVESLRRAAEYARKRNACAEASHLLERALQVLENLSDSGLGKSVKATAEEIRRELSAPETAVVGSPKKPRKTSMKV